MLGSRIALCRRAHGLSQADLANRLNISPSAIGMYEQGRREPSCDILVALSRELDVSVDYLLTGEPCTKTISPLYRIEGVQAKKELAIFLVEQIMSWI